MFDSLRKCAQLIGRKNRRRWVMLIGLAAFTSALEAAGALLVFGLLSVVADPEGPLVIPRIGDVRRFFVGIPNRQLLLWMSGAMGAFVLLRAGVRIGQTYIQNRVAENAAARLSTRLVRGYLGLPYSFHLRRNSAELIRNAHSAVQQLVQQVFVPVIVVIAETLILLGLFAVLLLLAPVATGLAIAVMTPAVLVMLKVIHPRLKRLGQTSHQMSRETLRSLQQALHGLRDVKVLGRERFFAREYGRSRLRMSRARYLYATAVELPSTVMQTVILGFILAFFIITIVVSGTPQGAVSVLGLFAYVGLKLQPSMQKIVKGINNLKFSEAAIDDVHADLVLVERDAPDLEGDPPSPMPFERELLLEGVSFSYEGTDRPALRDVDLRIEPGEAIGICGPTGGGKTTLTDLMTGLLAPTSGRVTVDGLDIRDHVRAWHRNLGVVPQTVFLVDDTLRRNIALGLFDEEMDEEALSEAVNLAQLYDVVGALPEGLDTVVGERGVRISGGQRQRVSIARALYRRPKVLILDEGTAALDNTTEQELMEALEQLRGDHTIILIAHRLSTVRRCDRIVYMDGGRIAAVDTYERLLQHNHAFRRMAASA